MRSIIIGLGIVGLLACLAAVTVWRALQTCPGGHRPQVEIDQLNQAIQSYKEKHLAYPPSMSEINLTNRRVHFMRHIQVAFNNADYGTAETNYVQLRDQIKTNFGANTQGYNYKNAAGEITPLDLDTLDQAEAIVFWLGGFPTPYNTTNESAVANRRIFGFHRDQDSPFHRDSLQQEGADPMRYRTELFYQFDETRLIDDDDDGWYEYSPLPQSVNVSSAPYVYFDADSYGVSSSATGTPLQIQLLGYPRSGDPHAAELASRWGLAVPLAQYVDPSNTSPMLWQNPESFQIICAGLDGLYSDGITGDLSQAYRIPVFPKGQVFDNRQETFTQVHHYTDAELDNLNNFSKQTLKAARENAGS